MLGSHLSIIALAGREEGIHGIVSRDQKAGKVDKELARDVEEDEEEVNSSEAKEGIDFRHGCLLFKIVEHRILGELGFFMDQQWLQIDA